VRPLGKRETGEEGKRKGGGNAEGKRIKHKEWGVGRKGREIRRLEKKKEEGARNRGNLRPISISIPDF